MKKSIPQVKWDAIVNLGARAIQARERVDKIVKILKKKRSSMKICKEANNESF